MDYRKCKVCTAVFGILFSGIMLSEWSLKGVILFIWILIWLSAAIAFLAKQKNSTAHYGISFGLTIMLQAALLSAENFVMQGMICLGIFLSGLLALYRTCYRERGTNFSDMLRTINYLFFANLTVFLYPGKLPPKEKEKRTFHKIAAVTAFLCLVLYAGLNRLADIHIANLMRFAWKLITENIAYIVYSITLGLILTAALYGYLYGLLESQPEQIVKKANTNETYDDKKDLWKKLFCNPICGVWVLKIIIFCDCIFLIVNLLSYWNLFGLDFGASGIAYRSSGFGAMLIMIILSECIFGGIYYVLECEKRKGDNSEIDTVSFKKCRYWFILAVLMTFLIWIFAVARYCNIVYANGINSSNKQGIYGLLICMVIWGYFLLYGLNLSGSRLLKKYFHLSMIPIILTAFLWSSMTFPLYNMLFFADKIEHQQLTYSLANQSMNGIAITEKDINIRFMEESGLFAVTSLVKLLDYSNAYEGTEGSVADAAMESIGRIFSGEFSENRAKINAAEGIEKISLIAEYMGSNPDYLLGIRRQCKQAVTKYISQHN